MLCLFASNCHAAMSSASYSIPTMTMPGGGGVMSSASYHTVSTLGQPSPLGSASSASYNYVSGFWHTLMVITMGDINGDGVVNLKDVIAVLQVVIGQLPASIILEADVDGDGHIGVPEALMVLQKVSGM